MQMWVCAQIPTSQLSCCGAVVQDYAYYSIDEYCNKNREDRTVVSIDSYEDVPTNDEAKLAQAVTAQPISVAICASNLQFYSSGKPLC